MFVPKIYQGVPYPGKVIPMGAKKLSWRDVLDCKKTTYAHIGDMAWAAVDHGYEYFVWEGKVYHCNDHVGEDYKDTGIKPEDLT